MKAQKYHKNHRNEASIRTSQEMVLKLAEKSSKQGHYDTSISLYSKLLARQNIQSNLKNKIENNIKNIMGYMQQASEIVQDISPIVEEYKTKDENKIQNITLNNKEVSDLIANLSKAVAQSKPVDNIPQSLINNIDNLKKTIDKTPIEKQENIPQNIIDILKNLRKGEDKISLFLMGNQEPISQNKIEHIIKESFENAIGEKITQENLPRQSVLTGQTEAAEKEGLAGKEEITRQQEGRAEVAEKEGLAGKGEIAKQQAGRAEAAGKGEIAKQQEGRAEAAGKEEMPVKEETTEKKGLTKKKTTDEQKTTTTQKVTPEEKEITPPETKQEKIKNKTKQTKQTKHNDKNNEDENLLEIFKADEEIILKKTKKKNTRNTNTNNKKETLAQNLNDRYSDTIPDTIPDIIKKTNGDFVQFNIYDFNNYTNKILKDIDKKYKANQNFNFNREIDPYFIPIPYNIDRDYKYKDGFFTDIYENPITTTNTDSKQTTKKDKTTKENNKKNLQNITDKQEQHTQNKQNKPITQVSNINPNVQKVKSLKKSIKLTFDFKDMFNDKYYRKYKNMLNEAAYLVAGKKLDEALEYYYVIQDQNIPKSFKMMIQENIKDIENTITETFYYSDTIVKVKDTGEISKLRIIDDYPEEYTPTENTTEKLNTIVFKEN